MKTLYNLCPSRIDVNLLSTNSPDSQAQLISDSLQNDIFMIRLQQLAWEAFKGVKRSKEASSSADFQSKVASLIEESGIKDIIVNSVVRLYERNVATTTSMNSGDKVSTHARKSQDETIRNIRESRISWEQGINEELLAIAAEMNRPLNITRPANAKNNLLEPGAHSASAESIRFLFDSEDLYETGIAIKSSCNKPLQIERYLGMIKVDINVPKLNELIAQYLELSPNMTQLGIDDTNSVWGNKLSVARHEEGEMIASFGNALDARRYMRRGVPPSLRAKIWRVAFGLPEEPSGDEKVIFETLRNDCDKFDLITDELYIHDVQMVVDDPRFFVFEEELKETALMFSRDEWLRYNSDYEIHKPLLPDMKQNISTPPCAIQPFLGLARYFGPICYIFKNRISLYSMARLTFAKLWCRMNVFSADPGTLLHTCKTFESLLICLHPKLFLHLINIDVPPMQVALPWLQLGFVNLLEMDQILHLWDRVIGFMDTTILAVLAVAIFLSRSQPLLHCKNKDDALSILAEGSRLKVICLIQMVLFSENEYENKE